MNKELLQLLKKNRKKVMLYIAFIMLINFGFITVYATDDPLTVINNLSNFIFSVIRAIGMILLGFGIVQIGLSLKSHDPSQRANVRLVGALRK